MNIWESATITSAGVSLFNSLTAGGTITITRAAVSTGSVLESNLSAQTALAGTEYALTLRPASKRTDGATAISTRYKNTDLETGFTANQLGIYCYDADGAEMLLYIAQATSGYGVEIPSADEMSGYSADWTLYIKFSDAGTISITVEAPDEEEADLHVVGDTAPEDANALWIDTSAGNTIKYYDESAGEWVAVQTAWG